MPATPACPRFSCARADCDRVAFEITNGKHPVLEIAAENRWYPGPIKQYNVVADIPGTEKPDEVVIVSGHFDSWNGPGSQGACDNGVGAMTAMEAARILSKVRCEAQTHDPVHPVVGRGAGSLYGSAGYVKRHPDELPKISAVLVDDGGTELPRWLRGHRGSQKDIMETAYAPVVKAFPDMPMVFRHDASTCRGAGEAITPRSTRWASPASSPSRRSTRRTAPRTTPISTTRSTTTSPRRFPAYLVQSSVDHAVVSYNLACLPELLPRDTPPAPAAG